MVSVMHYPNTPVLLTTDADVPAKRDKRVIDSECGTLFSLSRNDFGQVLRGLNVPRRIHHCMKVEGRYDSLKVFRGTETAF